jgi:hypothetical protein
MTEKHVEGKFLKVWPSKNKQVHNKHMVPTDMELYARLAAIESRLSILEQILLRIYALIQEHRRLMGGG